MGKPVRDPHALTTSVFLVLELELDRGTTPSVNVVCSLPGRDGALTRRWRTIQGRLDAPQCEDLLAWCQTSIMNALVSWTGTQGVLPME
jgi:hypothetical protein